MILKQSVSRHGLGKKNLVVSSVLLVTLSARTVCIGGLMVLRFLLWKSGTYRGCNISGLISRVVVPPPSGLFLS